MKRLLSIVFIFSVIVLSSCVKREDINESASENSKAVQYGYVEASWPSYETPKALINAANTVIVGKVTGISFQVLDMKTTLPPAIPPTKTMSVDDWMSSDFRLHTLYDVDIVTSYKGALSGSTQVRLYGGKKDFLEGEQVEILAEWGQEGIPLMEGNIDIEIGGTYLFVLNQHENNRPTPINVTQTVYNLRDPLEKYTPLRNSPRNHDKTKYYTGSRGQFGYQMSAKDVISAFGDDVWENFWEHWQRDNPDWETWIDRADAEMALAEKFDAEAKENYNHPEELLNASTYADELTVTSEEMMSQHAELSTVN